MKILLSILIYLMITNSLWAVNKYSINDILYVIDDNVPLQSEPDSNSDRIKNLSKGSVIKVLENKYEKSGDIRLNDDDTNWQSALTGRWTKINFDNKIGYIFDAYLSHLNFNDLVNSDYCISHDTLKIPDYELYTRTMYLNGMIHENGIGMEWGKEIFLIPDFSFEEAILFIKPNVIDYSYGKQNWLFEESKIQLKETDGISSRELEIVKYGEYVIVEITDGV